MNLIELIEQIKQLKIGHSFQVDTESNRIEVLKIAKILGKRLTTRKREKGGYTVTCLPE